MSSAARVLAALVAGLAAGTVISWGGQPALLSIASAAEPVGTLWVNAIRMTVIPLVVSLLISRIASETPASIGRIGGRALLLFVLLIGGAALFAAAIAPPVVGRMWLDASVVTAARGGAAAPAIELPSFGTWLIGLVPTNPVKAAAEDAMLPLILFTALFGCALSRVSPDHRHMLVRFFGAVTDTMFVVVRWVLAFAPVGVFVLSLTFAARGGVGTASALGELLVAVCGLLLLGTFVLYPVAVLFGRVSFRRFAQACAPAQAVAFSTRSSFACLPAMIDGAERKLGLSTQVTGLILPIAVSVFKFGAPILRMTGMLFIARLYGIDLGAAAVATMAVAVAALSFYTPGIPSGSLFVIAPVFTAFGLPMDGIGLLLAVDLIPDMFVTAANVTADMTVATLLSRRYATTETAAGLESVGDGTNSHRAGRHRSGIRRGM